MLAHSAEPFALVARDIAAPADPQHPGVLIHCTAGKDRTGVATALILEAVGVQRTAIIEDYTATEQNLSGAWLDAMVRSVERFGMTVSPALAEIMGNSPADAIEQALAWVDAQGGSAAYLQSGGLSKDELAAVRARFTG